MIGLAFLGPLAHGLCASERGIDALVLFTISMAASVLRDRLARRHPQ